MIGSTILHYKILEKLGEGGMGVVYLAEDTKLERKVAIKFLPEQIAGNSEERERFKIEAKAAAALNHPNIATIYAIEETEDQMFISMEYIKGVELKNKITSTEGGLNTNETIKIAIQIAEGLEAAHKEDIIHRDIKSSNIMITDNGKVKIMDFGLAKIKGGTQVTKIGTTVGTLAYMSPEQARGEELDLRTDIWSFGVVLYELLTAGHLPFEEVYDHATLYSIINEEHAPVTEYSENCSSSMLRIVDKCLQKDRNNRYQAASEILEDIEHREQDRDYEHKTKTTRVKHFYNNGLRTKKIFAIFLVIAVIIALSFFLPRAWQKIKDFAGWNSAPEEQHLIVLPLTNIGGDSNKLAFCEGLLETLTSNITQLEQFRSSLWVVPASEVIQNNIKSASEAYKRYGVNLAVTGSIQFLNGLLKLNINLVDAKNLRQLNSAIIDIETKDISFLDNKVVIKLLEMLHIELEPQLKDILDAGKTTVPEAYEYYVQGIGNLQQYQNAGNVEEAIRLLKLAIQIDPNYAVAYARLGEAYWRDYDLTKKSDLVNLSKNAVNKGYMIDSKLASVNVTLGMIYNGTGNYDKAILHFKKALASEPSDAAAFRGLAKAYQNENKDSEAESTYKQAIKLKPDYWAGYNDLGKFYYGKGRIDEAIKEFKQVVKFTPNNYRGYNNVGAMYYALGQLSDAREMFENSLQVQPNYYTYSNLGVLYYKEGNYDKAAQMYREALKINNNDYLMWGNLAVAQHYIPGKSNESLETYNKAISMAEKEMKVNANDPEIISNLAGYYADVDDTTNAIELLNKSLKIAPDNSAVMYRAATISEHFKNREKALYWIKKALKNGYSRSEIEQEPELKELTSDGRYKQLVSELNKNNDK